jgi:hypothetical protein
MRLTSLQTHGSENEEKQNNFIKLKSREYQQPPKSLVGTMIKNKTEEELTGLDIGDFLSQKI